MVPAARAVTATAAVARVATAVAAAIADLAVMAMAAVATVVRVAMAAVTVVPVPRRSGGGNDSQPHLPEFAPAFLTGDPRLRDPDPARTKEEGPGNRGYCWANYPSPDRTSFFTSFQGESRK